jgi:anti-sigma regulatory factor (Ser/Thr protein kinase)
MLNRMSHPVSHQDAHAEERTLPCGVGEARTALSRFLERRAWEGDVDALLMAVQEALVNADRHGGGLRDVCLRWDRELVVEVADYGAAFDWQPYVTEPPDLLAERGRGLWLIGQVATDLEVVEEAAGSRVRLTFDPEGEGVGDQASLRPSGEGAVPALDSLAPELLDALGAAALVVDRRLIVRHAAGELDGLLGMSAEEVVGHDMRGVAAEVKHRFADASGYETRLLDLFAHTDEETDELLVMVDQRLMRQRTFPVTDDAGEPAGRVLLLFSVAEQTEILSSFQRSLLPAIPRKGRLDIGAIYHPAQASAFVGGDFYDFIPLAEGGVCVVVGDVAGRGPAAAATSVRTRAYLRAVLATTGLNGTVPALEDALRQEFGDEDFVTMVMAVQESPDVWSLTSCGHPPAMRARDGQAWELAATGTLLGSETGRHWARRPFVLEDDEVLLLYTDGVTEAGSGRNRFGHSRLRETLAELSELPAQRLVEAIDERVHAFSGEHIDDDHVLLAVRRA